MKVGELKALLKTMDDHIELFGYVEEGDSTLIYSVEHITIQEAVMSRDEEGIPNLVFKKDYFSQPVCIIEMLNINQD